MNVDVYLATLEHSRKPEIEQIRAAILASDPDLSETIKWNAPNFVFAGEDRVTFRLQPGDRVDLIVHRGARTRADVDTFDFVDTSGLIVWATRDRGVIAIPEGSDMDTLLPQLLPVIRAWVRA